MGRGRDRRSVFRAAAAALAAQLGAGALGAQTVVPAQGEGTVSLTYQNYYVRGHFNELGVKNKNGGTHTKALYAQVDYGITHTIGLTVSLPYIASKYTGPPEGYLVGSQWTLPGPLDEDRVYHGAFQDVSVEVRRMFLAGRVACSPFVGVSVPTHAYQTQGEAVPGRHRRELRLGAGASSVLEIGPRPVYIDARYSYGVAERELGFPYTHSNVNLDGGFGVAPRLILRGLVDWQVSHKGPTVAELHDVWLDHDRLLAPNYLNLGVGTSIALTRSTEVYAVWVGAVRGKRGAHVARALAVGTSWSFGGGLGNMGPSASISRPSIPPPLPVASRSAHGRWIQ